MRYRDKNQRNYIERITNTKNNNNVEGSTKKTTQRKSYVKIVLKSTKSENCCTRRKGEKLESSKAKYRSLDRSISQQKGASQSWVFRWRSPQEEGGAHNTLRIMLFSPAPSYPQVTEWVRSACLRGIGGHLSPKVTSLWTDGILSQDLVHLYVFQELTLPRLKPAFSFVRQKPLLLQGWLPQQRERACSLFSCPQPTHCLHWSTIVICKM